MCFLLALCVTMVLLGGIAVALILAGGNDNDEDLRAVRENVERERSVPAGATVYLPALRAQERRRPR